MIWPRQSSAAVAYLSSPCNRNPGRLRRRLEPALCSLEDLSMDYYINRLLLVTFDEAVARTKDALKLKALAY